MLKITSSPVVLYEGETWSHTLKGGP